MGDVWGHPFVERSQEVLWPPIVRIPEWRVRAEGVQWSVMPSKGDAVHCRGVYVAHKSDTARDASRRRERNFLIGESCALDCTLQLQCTRGRLIPMSTHPKLTNKPTKRLALQHELLAFSGCPGLRLFASFLKLDQGFRMKLSPALKTHSTLQTPPGPSLWSEVSNVKVMNASSLS